MAVPSNITRTVSDYCSERPQINGTGEGVDNYNITNCEGGGGDLQDSVLGLLLLNVMYSWLPRTGGANL